MELLMLGLATFFGIHLVPAAPALHRRLEARMGANGWKGFMALIAVAGFALIVIGWQRAPYVPIYTPNEFGLRLPRILMLPALVLLAAAYIPSNIKRITCHPMLWATVIWAAAHLFANGNLRSLLLFGSFLAWALFEMWSLNRRGAFLSEQKIAWYYDAGVAVTGLAAYALLTGFHGKLFGATLS